MLSSRLPSRARPQLPPRLSRPPTPGPATPEGPVTAEAARLDDIEQTARIALRKHELLEEEAAKRAKEAPKVTIDDKGFSMGLPDKSYVLKIQALMQADSRYFLDNDALQANDTFLIRRFRPSLSGTLFSIADYRLLPEFAGTVTILDAYVDLHPREWLRLRIGKYKAPIGLERLQNDADLPVLERGLDQNLTSTRDIGVQLWGDIAGGIVHYVVGVFNGASETNQSTTPTSITRSISWDGCSSSRSRRSRCAGSATSASGSRWAPAIARAGCPPRPRPL
jgi:phosphate-selective porin OprO/OprP